MYSDRRVDEVWCVCGVQYQGVKMIELSYTYPHG